MKFEEIRAKLVDSLNDSTQSKDQFLSELTTVLETAFTDLAIKATPVPVGAKNLRLSVYGITVNKQGMSLSLMARYSNEEIYESRKSTVEFPGRFTVFSNSKVISWNAPGSIIFDEIRYFTNECHKEFGKICISEIKDACDILLTLT